MYTGCTDFCVSINVNEQVLEQNMTFSKTQPEARYFDQLMKNELNEEISYVFFFCRVYINIFTDDSGSRPFKKM